MTPVECAATLGLDNIKDKPWHISGCTATTGQGIGEGLDWLAGMTAFIPILITKHIEQLDT